MEHSGAAYVCVWLTPAGLRPITLESPPHLQRPPLEGVERLPRPAVSRAGRLGRLAGSGDSRSPEAGDSRD